MKYLSVLFLTILFGCSQRDSKIHSFIVPIDTIPNFKSAGYPRMPPPSKSYYFPSNFIIDSAGLIFYCQQQVSYGIECGTGVEWNTPPPFINLKPNDIIEIPSNNIEQFIKSNIQYLDKSKRLFAIASELDTATSVGLANILTVFKDTSNHIKWNFRKTTQEENVVLGYKKRKESYNSEDIKWDSSKISHPPNSQVINFTVAKVEKF